MKINHVHLTSYLTLLLLSITLTGCSINASIDPMTYDYKSSKQPPKNPDNKSLVNAIQVAKVRGGHKINPLLSSEISNENYKLALERSLQKANLYQASNSAKYVLKTKIVRLARPIAGINLTSKLSVNYTLSNVNNNRVLFHKTINSSYTASIHDSMIAVTRLKIANEGVARENIKQLIDELYKIK